jgi:hypothetical protein
MPNWRGFTFDLELLGGSSYWANVLLRIDIRLLGRAAVVTSITFQTVGLEIGVTAILAGFERRGVEFCVQSFLSLVVHSL